MPCIEYQQKRFGAESERLIEIANKICDEYTAQGYTLTLRQLYYQFVARGIIANKMTEYKRLGSIINDARLAGRIDWDAIEDRTRNLEKLDSWDSPRDILESCSQQFRFDRWDNQKHRVEVWIEKEALVGVVEPVCNRFRVPYFACRGYASQSELWRAGQRFMEHNYHGQEVIILHLGDHDPSGIDMTRDNDSRIEMFTEQGNVRVRRLALNWEQVQEYKPPPNPAKITDSRAEGYIRRFGRESWELDALEPRVIDDLISDNIQIYIDEEKWKQAKEREAQARDRLKELAENWSD